MDTVNISIVLEYRDPVSDDEYRILVDRISDLLEREFNYGGELYLEASELYDYELNVKRNIEDD